MVYVLCVDFNYRAEVILSKLHQDYKVDKKLAKQLPPDPFT